MDKENHERRKRITLLMGLYPIKTESSEIQSTESPYPVRFYSLGKSRGSEQGVGGWRQQYHRPPKRNGSKKLRTP